MVYVGVQVTDVTRQMPVPVSMDPRVVHLYELLKQANASVLQIAVPLASIWFSRSSGLVPLIEKYFSETPAMETGNRGSFTVEGAMGGAGVETAVGAGESVGIGVGDMDGSAVGALVASGLGSSLSDAVA